jgi:hypothetical protein
MDSTLNTSKLRVYDASLQDVAHHMEGPSEGSLERYVLAFGAVPHHEIFMRLAVFASTVGFGVDPQPFIHPHERVADYIDSILSTQEENHAICIVHGTGPQYINHLGNLQTCPFDNNLYLLTLERNHTYGEHLDTLTKSVQHMQGLTATARIELPTPVTVFYEAPLRSTKK